MTEHIIVGRLKGHLVYFHPQQPFSDCYLVGRLAPFEVFEDEKWFTIAGGSRWRIGQRSKSGYRIHSNDTYDNIEDAEQACMCAPREDYLALVQVNRNDRGTPMVTIRKREYDRFLFKLPSPVPKSTELTADEKSLLVQGVEVYRTPAIGATQELPLQDLIDEVGRVASRLGRFPTIIEFRLHGRFDYKGVMKRLKVTRWPDVRGRLDVTGLK